MSSARSSIFPATTSDPASPAVTLFLLDLGTTGKYPSLDHIQSLAILLYPLYLSTTSPAPPPKFSSHIRPPTYSPSPRIHPFYPVWREALAFINNHTLPSTRPLLVAHNAPFDAAFLAAEVARAHPTLRSYPPLLFADSLPLARTALPFLRGPCPYSQKSLADHFAIPIERNHHADYDVDVLAQVLRQLDAILTKQGASLIDELDNAAVSLERMAMRFEFYHRPSASSSATSNSNEESAKSYYIEKNGAYYHGSSECYGLRSASKFLEEVAQPHSGLQPCPNRLCLSKEHIVRDGEGEKSVTSSVRAPDPAVSSPDHSLVTDTSGTPSVNTAQTVVSRGVRKDGALNYNSHQSGYGGTSAAGVSTEAILTTRSGKYYHSDRRCRNLRKAKALHEVMAVNPHLAPCPECWRGGRAPVDVASPLISKDDGKYIQVLTTRTGKYYHKMRDCFYLRRAVKLITVQGLPTDLAPCPKCFSRGGEGKSSGNNGVSQGDDESQVSNVSNSPGSSHATEIVSEYCPRERRGKYITTRTGKYFHMDEDCRWLNRARDKFRVSTVPSDLMACPRCCGEEGAEQGVIGSPVSVIPAGRKPRLEKEEGRDDTADVNANSQVPLTKETSIAPYGSIFYRTRTGTKFHIDKDCRYLRGRETFDCYPLQEERDPCRGCALGLFQEWALEGWITGK